jgi:AsmA protein
MQRRWIKFVLAAVVLFIVVIGLVPFLINADTFRPKIESELSSSLGRKVTLGHQSLSLITGRLAANDISIADDSTFSSAPFLEAKQLHFGIELGQFLFHHLVQITDITIDSPAIHLIHNQNGAWNFSNIGSASGSTQAGSQQDSIIPSLTIAKLKIKDGSATLSSMPAAGKSFECTAINLDVQQFSFAKSFPFQLSVKVPGDGSLQLKGNAGPISQKDAADTPFQAKLQLTHFDPVAANVVQPSDGISMLADFDAQVASDGTNLTSTGKIVASRLKLARNGSPAPQPVNIDYTISDNLDARTGKVSNLSVHNGSAAVQVTGGFKMTGQAVVLDLHLAAPTVSIDQLEQLLPAVGVNLPSGSKLQGGTITANLAITGPITATTIAGPVEMDNTQLAGFYLGSKIKGINRLPGTSGSTGIQKLRTDLESSPQGTRFSNIDGSIPAIGTATGNGAVSPSGALDFQLVAKFSGSSAVGAVANQGMNALAGLLGDRSNTAADKGIPLTIAGTTSNPTFRANVGAMVKQQAGGLLGQSSGQQPSNAVKTLKGLFGK